MHRVVVTGLGIVSSVGVGVKHAWANVISSKSGIVNLDDSFVPELPSKVAGVIPKGSYGDGAWDVNDWLSVKEARKIDSFIQYACSASDQAMLDAGLVGNLSDEDRENFGVHIGSGIGGLQTIYQNSNNLAQGGYKKITPFFVPASLVNLPSGHVSIKYGLYGPNLAYCTACATGTHAIGDAYRFIRDGDADLMLAGGAEASVNNIGLVGFARMHALSTSYNDHPHQSSRPWDKGRDGFVMSEGSAVLVLEEYEHAKKRGAKIYAEVVGFAASGDAHHITSPVDDGAGATRCMKKALKSAKLSPKDIDYINAHGTSTPLGDISEVRAIKNVYQDHAYQLSVSSTKSATGHALGAAGAIEAVFTVKALKDGIVPPTLNLYDPDVECDLDFVPFKAKEQQINYAMSNSFGFGGTNGVLIFKNLK